MIRDNEDYAAHIGYCHINPLTHGLAKQVADWPYSTFHRLVERGVLSIKLDGTTDLRAYSAGCVVGLVTPFFSL